MMMSQKWKVSKYILLVLFILLILLNVYQYTTVGKKNKSIKHIENTYKQAYKVLEEVKKENELKYEQNITLLNEQILQLQNQRETDSKKLQYQLNQIQKKYEKDYINILNTPIDSTLIISQRQLSQEIDYSKFPR